MANGQGIMAPDLFQSRLLLELEPINQALLASLAGLPAPCRPVAEHVMAAGGKRLRPFLTVLFARLHSSASSTIYRLAASMEMLHAATLLHDDILDNALVRRGQPAAHTIFGQTKTLLAGDALLALGNAVVAEFGIPELTACYSRATMQTAAGEILEMASLGRPDLEHAEYLAIAKGKTGCLIAQACAMGALFAGAHPESVKTSLEFGENLGLGFQLVDDALDFAPQSETGKPGGGDLRERKMTAPIRLYREQLEDRERVRFDEIFRNGEFGPEESALLVTRIRPFAEKSLVLADECLLKARETLENLPEKPEREILSEMIGYVRHRRA